MSPSALEYLFITNIPSPYQVDFFNALERQRPGSFHVIFCAAIESDRQFTVPKGATFSMEVLASPSRRWMKDWHRNPLLSARLSALDPKLVVIGGSYFMPDARTARAHCLRHQLPWMYWGEDPFKKSAGGMKARLKQMYLAHFMSGAAGAIGIGSRATRTYAAFAGNRPTTSIPYSPDLSKLLSPSAEMIQSSAQLRRDTMGDDAVAILFSGALIERKAPDLLLRAFTLIASELPSVHLIFAGDGPMRAELEASAANSGLASRVHFLGFLQGERLAQAYLASDIFVLPSRWHEGWGVVVQEAMAARLAVVVSDIVAAGADLIAPGRSGLCFSSENVAELQSQLIDLCRDAELRRRLGDAAARAVASTSAGPAASAFVQFADRVLHHEIPSSHAIPAV